MVLLGQANEILNGIFLKRMDKDGTLAVKNANRPIAANIIAFDSISLKNPFQIPLRASRDQRKINPIFMKPMNRTNVFLRNPSMETKS